MTLYFAEDLRAPADADVFSWPSAGRRAMGRKDSVAVIDDDISFREAVADLIRAFGFNVSAYAAAASYLQDPAASDIRCLVLDIHMPGMTGLDLQRRLAAQGRRIPIIFVTSDLDDRTHARALNEGALAVLEKPCDHDALLKHIKLALRIQD